VKRSWSMEEKFQCSERKECLGSKEFCDCIRYNTHITRKGLAWRKMSEFGIAPLLMIQIQPKHVENMLFFKVVKVLFHNTQGEGV
jgi:hypothetical protein